MATQTQTPLASGILDRSENRENPPDWLYPGSAPEIPGPGALALPPAVGSGELESQG